MCLSSTPPRVSSKLGKIISPGIRYQTNRRYGSERKDVPKFARVVSREEIRNNEYNLNIPRYVDSSEAFESWDIYASMFGGIPKKEIEELSAYWQAFPQLKAALFTEDSGEHVHITEGNLKDIIKNHPNVVSFKEHYARAFTGFDAVLYNHLVEGMELLNISKEETVLSHEIFSRLASVRWWTNTRHINSLMMSGSR